MKTLPRTYLKIITVSLIVICFSCTQKLFAQEQSSSLAAKIKIEFIKEDSTRQVKATVLKTDSAGKETPVAEVEINIYAKKSFGLLPLADAQTTDKNGEVMVDFPADLPGDSLGIVEVVAKVTDNEVLGSIEEMKSINWGIPKFIDRSFYRRALWASGANAPIPLVVTVSSMVFGVWSVILYIIVQLFKIKKS